MDDVIHGRTLANALCEWVIVTEELYNAAITAVKLSILLLYRRIFPDARFKIALCAVGGFVISCGVTMNLLVVFQCNPINASWNPSVQSRQCIRLNTAFIIFGSLNALTGKESYKMMKDS